MQQTTPASSFSPRLLVLLGMIGFATASRLLGYFVPGSLPPNFTPVESIALFGGAYFADRRLAFGVPLLAMLLADLIIALHQLSDGFHTSMPVVYGCIALTVVLGFGLRNCVNGHRVLYFSLASASLFFLLTNFSVWLTSGMYPLTGSGLATCFLLAIPFFKWTVAGTLFWSAVLFGGFEMMRRRYPLLEATAV